MAYVTPNGVIQLFKGVNLNNEYTHTLYFANESAQNTFFSSLAIINGLNYNAQSYTRVNHETVRIQVNAETVQRVTYMRFNNRNNKWYYAFVIGINYVNENCTEIVYEIDVMQTWFIQNGGLNPCYVERMHVAISDDKLKNHLEPEPVASDVYRFDEVTPSNAGSFGGYDVVINTTNEPSNVDNLMQDGVVCGSQYWCHSVMGGTGSTLQNNLTEVKNYIADSLGDWDKNEQSADITDMYMFPHKYTANAHQTSGAHETYHVHFNPADTGHTFDYPVRNKKMYTYPYCFLFATTKGGACAEYHWEYFDEDVSNNVDGAEFRVIANSTGGGSVMCYPIDYEGINEHLDANLLCDTFPKCSWAIDAYQAFVASGGQTKVNAQWKIDKLGIANGVIDTIQGAIGTAHTVQQGARGAGMAVLSAFAGNVSGTASGAKQYSNSKFQAFNQAIDTVQQGISTYAQYSEAKNKKDFAFKDASYAPNIMVGAQVPNIMVGDGHLGFYFYNCHIEPHEAVRVDNFFTMYGYAINNVVTPRLSGRAHWNFIKTNGAQITGEMPASSKSAIARIFDGGIFFWNSSGDVVTANNNIGNFMQQTVNTGFGIQIVND